MTGSEPGNYSWDGVRSGWHYQLWKAKNASKKVVWHASVTGPGLYLSPQPFELASWSEAYSVFCSLEQAPPENRDRALSELIARSAVAGTAMLQPIGNRPDKRSWIGQQTTWRYEALLFTGADGKPLWAARLSGGGGCEAPLTFVSPEQAYEAFADLERARMVGREYAALEALVEGNRAGKPWSRAAIFTP